MEPKDLLIGRMEDLVAQALKRGCAASRFLTPAEAQTIENHFKYHAVALSFDGGFENAERARAVFLQPDWGVCDRTELLTALQVDYRPQDTLRHRDILGALMALGVERDSFGDILAETPPATLVCLPELSGYILENFTMAGRVGVQVSAIALDSLPVKTESYTVRTGTVASLRLDAVLGLAFNLSRTKATELIAAGRVQLNHEPCLQAAKELSVDALLSVRGLGRARLLETTGVSRKGRLFVKLGVMSD